MLFSVSALAAPPGNQATKSSKSGRGCVAAKKAVTDYFNANDRLRSDSNGLIYEPVLGEGPAYRLVSLKPSIKSCKGDDSSATVKIETLVYAQTGFGGSSAQYPVLEKIENPPKKYSRDIHVHFNDSKWKVEGGDLFPEFKYIPAVTARFTEAIESCKSDPEKDACLKSVNADLTKLKAWTRQPGEK